jgi:hypothetical protein
MKKAIVAGLIAVAAVGQAHAWGAHEQGALAGIAGTLLFQQVTRPQVYSQPPVQVGYPGQSYPQVQVQQMPAPVYYDRTPPVYSQQYPGPNWGYSCVPAYDQFGRYLGCIR